MSRRQALRRLRSAVRSSLALCVLAGLLVGTIGFPMAPHPAGGRFPCQGHGCGCRTAGECWSGCCCLTPAQRLAWARANGVTPPAELERLVAADDSPQSKAGAKPKTCCAKHDAPRVCCRKADTSSLCCAGHGGANEKQTCGESIDRSQKPSRPSTPAFEPGRCRGLGQWWVAAGQPLALPERPAGVSASDASEPVMPVSACYTFEADSPPTRPG